jgi:glycosyltransferase involved in cell wall biosynthesis
MSAKLTQHNLMSININRADDSVEYNDVVNAAGGRCRAVLLVSPAWPPGEIANGIVSTVATKKQGLESLGVRCSVLSISRMVRCEDRPRNVFHMGSFAQSGRTRRFCEKLLNRVKRVAPAINRVGACPIPPLQLHGFKTALEYIRQLNGIDVIEVEESLGLPNYAARHSQLPVIARLHGPWFLNGVANGVEVNDAYHYRVRAEGEAIGLAHGVSSPSRFVLRAVETQYQLKLPCSAVIPNAIEQSAQSSIWDPKIADPNHVLFVGRFDRHKGADICLRAFVKVLEKRPYTQLTIVGPDRGIIDEKSDCLRHAEKWLRDEIRPTQLRSRINFRGRLSRDEVVSLRRESAVTIVPSRFDNFPTTVLESMSQGCPLVASRAGGIPEIIEHERNGLLCAAEDADELAANILYLLGNRTFAATLGRNALQDSLARYSPRVVAKQNLEFYEEVCARSLVSGSASRFNGESALLGEQVSA